MTLRTTSAHWIIHDGIGSGLWSLRQLPCDYRALVRAGLSRPQREREREREQRSAFLRKWQNRKRNLWNLQRYEKRKCRPRTTLFSLDFSRRYRISSFIDLIGGIPPIPNVFPISVTGFCDMTNARQINRVHYLPPDFKHFIHGKK